MQGASDKDNRRPSIMFATSDIFMGKDEVKQGSQTPMMMAD